MEKPKIRFKSFEKRWESYRLSEYSNYRRGSFPQPYGNKEWYGGDNAMPFVQVVDVLENLRLVADTKQKISTLAQPMSVFVPSDSVIVTLQGSIGRVAITQYDAYVDRTILIFEDYNSQTNKEFWAYTIRNKFEIERQKAPGGTIKTITKEALSDFKVSIPEYTEQSAIGSLFRTLDDLLASYKDNLANYRSLKATMFSKMFPKSGQTVPEIRLDGFEDEWKKAKLKDVAHRVQGNDGRMDLPTLTISASGGWMNQIDRFSANIAGKEQKNYTLLKKGELSYNHGNSKLAKYGVVFELKEYEEALVPKVYHSFRVNQLADAKFIEIMFSTKIPDRELGKLVSSGARMDGLLNISFDDFMNIAIIIPTIEEQRVIGTYFSNLDNFINSHQEKISQLETLKKKLLQDMFI